MRADAHYVDQLASRRETVHSDAPRPTRRAEPAESLPVTDRDSDPAREPRDGRDSRLEQLLAQVLADLGTIQASAGLLTGSAEPLARRANVDAVRAHAWRAAWMLRAYALADGTHRPQLRPRPLGGLLGQLRDGFAAECRLSGVDLQLAGDWNAAVRVDEVAMVTALSGAVFASLALLPDVAGAAIKVSAATVGHDLRSIEVTQDEAQLPAVVSSRFFDPAWTDRPGGWLAGLAAASVKAAALLHGGEAAFMAGARRGSTVRMSFATDRVS
jgi:hypothetical protein